jgi:hypothetical protein
VGSWHESVGAARWCATSRPAPLQLPPLLLQLPLLQLLCCFCARAAACGLNLTAQCQNGIWVQEVKNDCTEPNLGSGSENDCTEPNLGSGSEK